MESVDCEGEKIISINVSVNSRDEKIICPDFVETRTNGVVRENEKENLFTDNLKSMLSTRVVDGPMTLKDITNLSLVCDDAMGKCRNRLKRNEIALERWRILAKTLLKTRKNCAKNIKAKGISVRRFTSFDLIKPTQSKENLGKKDGCWLEYSTEIFGRIYRIEIHHVEQKLTAKELVGFNNTGNICIWPSEEVLAFYILSNLDAFEGKRVLEVGGGMTCMAGLLLAAYGSVSRVDLTDGNSISVENVRKIVGKNPLDRNKVASFQLDWANHRHLKETYDIVISSDCLFFDETRSDLVEAIWNVLKDDGVAVVMAPKRGETLNRFVKMAAVRGFSCMLRNHYEETIWRRHLMFKRSNPEYDENLHYPVLILLAKSNPAGLSPSILPSLRFRDKSQFVFPPQPFSGTVPKARLDIERKAK